MSLFPANSLSANAYRKLKSDRLSVICFWTVVAYGLIAIAAKTGLIASGWEAEVGGSYEPPSFNSLETIFGTDIFGRSVFLKTIQGTRIAMSVGLISSLISIPIGVGLGAAAGYFGGKLDEFIVWLYTVVSSIPNILLLIGISYAIGKGIFAVYIALGATGWVGLCRVIRAEFIKHKEREYVIAAESLGASHTSRIFKHILPNVSHQIIISFSLQFVTAIKAEVILSFLGLGVQNQPSWGVMIDDSKLELARGVWWQLSGATLGMFFVVLAFNLFGDALRDALDPKLK